jgi:hypothetical protein
MEVIGREIPADNTNISTGCIAVINDNTIDV